MLKSKNILQQEEEFLKMNEEIDLKTLNLMNEVDHIKEMQSNIDKFFSEWEKSKTNSQPSVTYEDKKLEDEFQGDFGFSKFLSEGNLTLREDISKHKNNTSPNASPPSEASEELPKKDHLRRNLKLSQSAKASSVLSTTNIGQDSILSAGLLRQKSLSKLKDKMENEILPESIAGMGHSNVTRFLTAKVKLLTEQVGLMQKEEKKHLDKIKELQTQKDKSVEEKEKLMQQFNMTKNVLVKYEKYTDDIQAQLQNTQAENGHLKREVENLKKELRQITQTSSASEVRLNRTLEEIEKLKTSLRQIKQEEKEIKDSHKRKLEDLTNTVKKLDRQRTELLNGFKKQLMVIDNLKKQKDLCDVAKTLKSAEEDFLNFLDCNPQNLHSRRELTKSVKNT